MRPPVRVRTMVGGDREAVARLFVASGLCRRRGLGPRLEAALAGGAPLCLVAKAGRQAVGAALGSFNGFHAFLTHIAVARRFQHLGVGRRLHAEFVRRARRLGARGVISDARLSAAGFFGRLGYRMPGAVFLVRRL